MLFCSLRNALPYSLAKCSPKKCSSWKEHLVRRAFRKRILESIFERPREHSLKNALLHTIDTALLSDSSSKREICQKSNGQRCAGEHLKRATKWQPFVTAGAAQLVRVKKKSYHVRGFKTSRKESDTNTTYLLHYIWGFLQLGIDKSISKTAPG